MKTSVMILLLLHGVLCGAGRAAEYNLLLADHTQKQLLIRSGDGRIVWKHASPSLFEAWVLADGSIVYSTGLTVEKIIPDLKAGEGGTPVWTYRFGTNAPDAPLPKGTIYTCTPLESGNCMVTESGTFRLVEISDAGKIVHVIKLPGSTAEAGNALRLTRHTRQNTWLVPYFGEGKVREFDRAGAQIREIDVGQHCPTPEDSAYEAIPLRDGRLLISCGPRNQILILDADGKVGWKLTAADLPAGMIFGWVTKVIPLANGNIIVCNYCKGQAETKAFEITPARKIVWQLRDPRIQGLTTLQLLTEDFRPLTQGGPP